MARRRGVKKIDNLIWELSTGSVLAQAAGTSALNFSTVGTTPTTLLRLRGEIVGYLSGTQSPTGLAVLTCGIIKVPEGSSTTAQYDPVSDANAPWLWFSSYFLGYDETVVDVIQSTVAVSSFRETIDNKAMRRIRPDEELQFVVTNTTVGAARSTNIAYSIRWLQGF